MDNPKAQKFSSHLVLTAALTGGITITVSLLYILLSIAALIIRFSEWSSKGGADFFWNTIVGVYIAEDGDVTTLDITDDNTVFVLAAITLAFTVINLAAAIMFLMTFQDEKLARFLIIIVSVYVGSCAAVLIVDLTTASHFGIDYSYLSEQLKNSGLTIAGLYRRDVLRHGAFLLMTIALKGYVIPVINWILIVLLIIYVLEHRKLLKSNDHSIHKLGALSAFGQSSKPDDSNWATPTPSDPYSPFGRGSHVNNGYVNNDDISRSPRRPPTRPEVDYSNRAYDRSDSWQRNQPNLSQSARPFSYLEDIKRPGPSRPPPSPAVEAPWNREPWQQGPPVPKPDYSPQLRLKSSLKPSYM